MIGNSDKEKWLKSGNEIIGERVEKNGVRWNKMFKMQRGEMKESEKKRYEMKWNEKKIYETKRIEMKWNWIK